MHVLFGSDTTRNERKAVSVTPRERTGEITHPWLPGAKPCIPFCSCRVCSFRPDSVRAGF